MSVPAERRRHRRYETRVQASVGPPGGRLRDCLVLDYCSGGVLVRQAAGAVQDGRQPGQRLVLEVRPRSESGPPAMRVTGRVAWQRGEHFGIAFEKAADGVVQALRSHDHLTAAGGAGPAAPGGGDIRALARLREFAQGTLPGLLRDLLVMTGEDLLEKAEEVMSDSDRQQIYGDIAALDRVRDGDSLTQAVLSAALEGNGSGEQDAVPGEGELCLVDPDDFERWLEASRVATLLGRRFAGRLDAIGSRLAGLQGGLIAPGSLTVPFEPKHFTVALKDLAKRIELGAVAREGLFGSAHSLLDERLNDFYGGIDQVLDAVGAPAARAYGRPIDPHAPDAEPARDDQAPAAGPAEDPARVDPHPVGDTTQPAAAPGIAGATPPPRDAVSPAQVGALALDPALVEQMNRREIKQREGLAQELMGYVSEAPNMTESLAEWMQQLGAPLAREAAADRGFFQNKQHPLREIVDGLGHLQMFRASPDPDPGKDPIRQQVSELLRPISEGEADPSVLRGIAEALGELTSDQSRLYQRNVERVVEASEGRERVRLARQAVSAEIRRRYAGRQVPEVMPELLEVGWRAVLELAAINSRDGDERYTTQLALLDCVVAMLGGEAFEPEPFETEPGRLFERIAQELASVAFDPFRRIAVETRLREALEQGAAAGGSTLIPMPEEDDETEVAAADACPEGIGADPWIGVLRRCADIVVGARIRLLGERQGKTELRVAWIRDDREVYVLVDHRGLRAREMRLAELAAELHRGRIEIEQPDGRPLSDRAVDSILVRMEQRLAHQAKHDSLTGLINRQQFHAALQSALQMPGRSEDMGVLLWLDVDQFRLVNDIHGYESGDRLLVALARLLEDVKGSKVLGHVGGDRFALIFPDVGLDDGDSRARGICESVRQMSFDWSERPISLSASVGVVPMGPQREAVGELLQAADDALAAAKAAGGDRSYVYKEEDPEIAHRKETVHWVVQVDDALARGHLRLRCQPIVPVKPGGGLQPHYEVLLGVHSGTSEPLPVAEFIEAAERYRRMRAVDRWVTQTVMEWIAAHRAHMPMLHGFAVNLSGQTASDPGFVEFVRDQFQRTGIDPAWLSFEVTETAAVSDLSTSAGIIWDLKSMGCKVALDDFGSGLASYSYLKELPVDWLKIDGVFVRRITSSREDLAVVKSINEIGHFLGKKTIAEYVADQKILRLIRVIGVDYAQGFGISPPLLMDELLQTDEAATG